MRVWTAMRLRTPQAALERETHQLLYNLYVFPAVQGWFSALAACYVTAAPLSRHQETKKTTVLCCICRKRIKGHGGRGTTALREAQRAIASSL